MQTEPNNTTTPSRIGLFGGTFDPVHTGHLVIAEHLREAASLDSVLFIPAANPPHKHANQRFTARQRYDMLCAAVAANPAFEVSDIELVRRGPSYTIDTIRELKQSWPTDTTFLFMVGRDNLYEIEQWKNPQAIVAECRLLVADRAADSARDIPGWLADRIDLIDSPRIDISSTDIRHRIETGQSIRYLVPDAVHALIQSA